VDVEDELEKSIGTLNHVSYLNLRKMDFLRSIMFGQQEEIME